MDFSVAVDARGSETTLALAGELDLASADTLLNAVHELLGSGVRFLHIDLTDLTFCDSTGLSALLRARNAARVTGGWCSISGAAGMVADLLRVTQLDEYLGEPAPAEPNELAPLQSRRADELR